MPENWLRVDCRHQIGKPLFARKAICFSPRSHLGRTPSCPEHFFPLWLVPKLLPKYQVRASRCQSGANSLILTKRQLGKYMI